MREGDTIMYNHYQYLNEPVCIKIQEEVSYSFHGAFRQCRHQSANSRCHDENETVEGSMLHCRHFLYLFMATTRSFLYYRSSLGDRAWLNTTWLLERNIKENLGTSFALQFWHLEFLTRKMLPAIVSNSLASLGSSLTERSMFPVPPATTDVLHTVFTFSRLYLSCLSSLCCQEAYGYVLTWQLWTFPPHLLFPLSPFSVRCLYLLHQ